MNYELRQYSFGETIGKGFNLYFNNFIPIVIISLVCHIPQMLLIRYSNTSHISRFHHLMGFTNFLYMGVVLFLTITLAAFLSAWIIHLVSKKFLENSSIVYDNKKTTIFPLVLPILGLSILVGFFTVICMLPVVVPGIIVSLGYSVASTVLVVERKKIWGSMKRSWDLTKGYKGTIFGFVFVIAIISFSINVTLTAFLRLLHLDPQLLPYLTQVVNSFTAPIHACVTVVIYFNLRIEKEGFNIEHLAQQFTLPEEQGLPLQR